MRNSLTIRSIIIFALLQFPAISVADMLVQSIEGAGKGISISRQGDPIEIAPLKRLLENDYIRVTDRYARLVLLGDDGQTITIDTGSSPYTVPPSLPRSWMDNALQQALGWYETNVIDKTQTVSTITRGEGGGPLTLLGMELGENLLPEGIDELYFRWRGGSAPYGISLTDATGKSVIKATANSNQHTLSNPLGLGEYQLKVTNSESQMVEERLLIVLPSSELPESVQALLAKPLPQELRAQFASILLASEAGWRFSALQKALQAHDTQLTNILLGMH